MDKREQYFEHYYDELRADYGEGDYTREEAWQMANEQMQRDETEEERKRDFEELQREDEANNDREYGRLSPKQEEGYRAAMMGPPPNNSTFSGILALVPAILALSPLVGWGIQKFIDRRNQKRNQSDWNGMEEEMYQLSTLPSI